MTKVKISGFQLSKLAKQEKELNDEINREEIIIIEKKKELIVLQDALIALQKLGEKSE